MKVKKTKEVIEDGKGSIESIHDGTAIVGQRGDLKFTFKFSAPEGHDTGELYSTLAGLVRNIEAGNQLALFTEEPAKTDG